ncbi:MAG: HEPN domain-containing protein [Magnetococcales bacterium]|nr:HEPN domain-containing protein [Magnetococcales bacterium]MBF0151224.1 HEPN domain-containing protein [Magnetococcales bacterium]
MKDLDQATILLRMAEKDDRALLVMQDPNVVATEIFGLHVQQAVEKGITAWLCLLGVSYPNKHDLDESATLLGEAGESIPDAFIPLLTYTDFAVSFRYEAFDDFDDDIDRQATTILVAGFLKHVNHLSASVN